MIVALKHYYFLSTRPFIRKIKDPYNADVPSAQLHILSLSLKLQLYIKCGAISSAIRVATEASAWPLVWRAGNSSKKHALYAASILENAGQTEQAIALYQKAGYYFFTCLLV